MLPVVHWQQRKGPAGVSTPPPQTVGLLGPCCGHSLHTSCQATSNGKKLADDFPFDDNESDIRQQRLAGRPHVARGVRLVKGTGTQTLAPGNLGVVRERLIMPAPAEFELHDRWALRAGMEKRRKKQAEDAIWRANKADKYSHRHMNVDYFTDYRCRDDDDPERHWTHEEIMNLITNYGKNANPFTVQHQCNNPLSVADWAGENIELLLETDEWIEASGLSAFGDILAPKAAPSQDMLDKEFQDIESVDTEPSDEGQDTSLSEDFSSFDMDVD